ncbi:MAG TPA: ABC transporter permease [Deltaproteobacteria bacterium]|nr:ABC transporter permease [Deltaproteobacteria bacterium]
MKILLELIRKEYIHFLRDLVLVVVVLYLFTIDIYTAGTGFNMDVKNVKVAVLDYDKSVVSRDYIAHLRRPYFSVIYVKNLNEGKKYITNGKATLFLVIPDKFGDIKSGKSVKLQLIADGTNSSYSTVAISYIETITYNYNLHLAFDIKPRSKKLKYVALISRTFYNENHSSPWFMGITELLSVITLVSVLLPSTALVREKERGTIEQLMVAPVSPIYIVAAKIISMVSISLLFSFVSIYIILIPMLQIPFRGSLLLFMLATAVYTIATTGIALFLSTLAKNVSQLVLMVIIVVVPLLFLSGSWADPIAMPPIMEKLTYLSPLRYYLDLSYGIILKGFGIRELIPQFVGLFAIALSLFVAGVSIFRKNFG